MTKINKKDAFEKREASYFQRLFSAFIISIHFQPSAHSSIAKQT